MSPTSLTLRFLRRAGYATDVVERWLPRTEIRSDLFHCIDLLAITIGEPVLGVQATTLGHMSARVRKAQHTPELYVWLRTGSRFQVFGWTMVGGLWHPRIVELLPGDMEPDVLAWPPRRGRSRHQAGDLFEDAE